MSTASSAASIFSNPAYTGTATGTSATKANKNLGQMDFMNLLIAQLKNQDPLNPVKDTEFISQLANFSSLEQMSSMNRNLEKFLAEQEKQNAAAAVSMIGREITDVSGTKGLVTGIVMNDDGVRLIVNGKEIAYTDVREVRNPLN
ncbi:MAG TPA: flagellar hook capping FlgD N-terminal domain-containing protein [Dissulfurispiraceae bacterium]|nr:flagellar hook capping FlgD N-terminal domain-containing protein [Dissulfurispiraceae bacterium]